MSGTVKVMPRIQCERVPGLPQTVHRGLCDVGKVNEFLQAASVALPVVLEVLSTRTSVGAFVVEGVHHFLAILPACSIHRFEWQPAISQNDRGWQLGGD